jgi:hypothetical protein
MATETEEEAEAEGAPRRRGLGGMLGRGRGGGGMRGRFAAAGAGGQLKTGASSVAGILAAIVMIIAAIAAAVLVLHIIFVMFDGNQQNKIVSHVQDYADSLAGPLKDLFSFKKPKTNVLVNYGIAAVIWAAGGQLVASLLRRLR